jgi:hypothetical protein
MAEAKEMMTAWLEARVNAIIIIYPTNVSTIIKLNLETSLNLKHLIG